MDDIEQRFLTHSVEYLKPDTTNLCWQRYRDTGSCGCDAEADMGRLLDQLKNRGPIESLWARFLRRIYR